MSAFRPSLLALCLPVLGLPAVALAEGGDMPASASTCVSCHSADGNPLVAGVPILAGQRADYLQSALAAYREGRRTGGGADVMQRFARELTEDQIKEIAAWFSAN